MSYCQILRSLEVARLGLSMSPSLWNLTCQISEGSDCSKPISCGFETWRQDVFTASWIETQIPSRIRQDVFTVWWIETQIPSRIRQDVFTVWWIETQIPSRIRQDVFTVWWIETQIPSRIRQDVFTVWWIETQIPSRIKCVDGVMKTLPSSL